MEELNVQEIQAKIRPLLGKKAWQVELGVGSFITFEFGAVVHNERIPERPHGEWHLWIMHCVWCLQKGGKFIAASEDSRSELQEIVKCMENLELRAIELIPPIWETILTFEKDVILRLFPVYSGEYEHWMLYTPDGNVLCIGPGSESSYSPSS